MKSVRLKAACLAASALLLSHAAYASPLYSVTILASDSQSGTYVPSLEVTSGETVFYKVIGGFNVGNTNTTGGTKTVMAVGSGDGMNSLSFNLQDAVANPIQIAFQADQTLLDGWTGGTSKSAGNASGNSLNLVRPAQAPGVFSVADILSGSFVVGASLPAGATSLVTGSFANTLSTGKVNNTTTSFSANTGTESGGDPFIGYNALTLTTAGEVSPVPSPAPAGAAVAAVGIFGAAGIIRRRRAMIA